jgi:hypothetical protein
MPVAAAVAGSLVERNTSRIIPMKIPSQPPKLMVTGSNPDRVASLINYLHRFLRPPHAQKMRAGHGTKALSMVVKASEFLFGKRSSSGVDLR